MKSLVNDQNLEVLPPPSLRDPQKEIQHTREAGPLSVSQVKAGLQSIHEVMRDCMAEGQDYGKVPGCGDKPGLFQPGAQKLSMMFQLNPAVAQETVTDYPNFNRGYRLVVRVTAGSKFAEGVGECSTMESKYRFRNANKVCPHCGKETVFRSKDKPEFYCWSKKGGCGNVFVDGSPMAAKINEQASGKVEHDNPPDFWNTVRKMAFKRAFVHAIINATNTSELWSQDLEDLDANGLVNAPTSQESSKAAPASPTAPPATSSRPAQQNAPQSQPEATATGWKDFIVPKFIKKYAGKTLGEMELKDLSWWAQNYEPKPFRGSISPQDEAFRAALDEAVDSGDLDQE